MIYLYLAIFFGFFFIFITLGIRLIKKRNHIALILLIPYLVCLIAGILPKVLMELNSTRSEVQIQSGGLLPTVDLADALTIMMSSKVTFGDGKAIAGGFVLPANQGSISEMLQRRQMAAAPGKTLLWLKDSEASKAIVEKDMLFISDLRESYHGIWIGWINGDVEMSKVNKMDGTGP